MLSYVVWSSEDVQEKVSVSPVTTIGAFVEKVREVLFPDITHLTYGQIDLLAPELTGERLADVVPPVSRILASSQEQRAVRAAGSAQVPAGRPELSPGDVVQVTGLQARPELNGCRGRLGRWVADRQRWEVRLESMKAGDPPLGLKATRLERVATESAKLKAGFLSGGLGEAWPVEGSTADGVPAEPAKLKRGFLSEGLRDARSAKAPRRTVPKRDCEYSDGHDSPALLVDGHWQTYDPSKQTIVVIGPGAGLCANVHVYRELAQAGYNVVDVHDQEYDVLADGEGGYAYPPGWQWGTPDLGFNAGKNLATFADDLVLPVIRQLVAEGRGPAAVLCGSRGGQVTLPRLWQIGWRGPCVVINGGCVSTAAVPGPPVRLVLATGGQDFFETKCPVSTGRLLKKDDERSLVLNYFHPDEPHMPQQLGGGVLMRLLEIACEEKFSASLQGPWPHRAQLMVI